MGYIYLYGQVMTTESFLLNDEFPQADGYCDIKEQYHLLGGETGIAAAILNGLDCPVRLAGTHLGDKNASLVLDYFKDTHVDTSELVYEIGFEGVMDYMFIDKLTRTGFGKWSTYYSRSKPWFEAPREEGVKNAVVVGADPYFGEEIIDLCLKYRKKFATIDSNYDSRFNQYCEIHAISHQHLKLTYPGMDFEELHHLYTDHSNGLIIFTCGENPIMYGRKGEPIQYFPVYPVNVVSTLSAGDSFKAGTIYGLYHGMSDDDIVRYACAIAGTACEGYPIPLKPPSYERICELVKTR